VLNELLFVLAKRFVSGTTVQEAVRAVQQLNEQGIMATLDVLGENVRSIETAEVAVKSYLETLAWIQKSGIQSNVSLKLTQMGLDIGKDFCKENLARVCEKAAETGNFVRIDMEGSAYTQRTLDIFHEIFESYKNVGIVLQAYLRRTPDDLPPLISVGARIRLCKGAYKEQKDIALQQMSEIRESFKKLASDLLREGTYPAIATHDDDLISWTKEFASNHGIAKNQFEFQMLYGLRKRTQIELAREGHSMRVYVPYGTHWIPYFYRRLRERRENVYFALRNLLKA
jgi:proline dehydrogenase